MRKSRKIISQVPPTFAFVVDGETEIWYLQMLKRNERQLRLNIEPKIPQRKSIEEQFKLVVDLSEREYLKVFWLIDVIFIINNPCLEFWFILHFEKTSKLFDTCAKAENELKKYLKDYEKTQKYFTKQDNDIYIKLKRLLKTAINNSESLGQFDVDKPTKAICEMH
jgi:hypothetical protein